MKTVEWEYDPELNAKETLEFLFETLEKVEVGETVNFQIKKVYIG